MIMGTKRSARKSLSANILIALLCVYLFWGGTYLGMQYAIQSIPPFLMAGARFALAGTILYVIMRLKGEKRPTWRQWRNGGIVASLLLLGGNGVVAFAEQVVPSSIASLLIAMVPLWIAGISYLTERRKPTLGALLGILLGLFGIVVLVWRSDANNGAQPLHIPGIIAILFASLSWATGTVVSKHVQLPKAPLLSTGMQMMIGGGLLLLVSLFHGDFHGFSLAAVTNASWLAFGYLVLFGSLVGFTAYIWLFKHADPFIASTYAYVNPIVAIFLGWLIAGEQIGLNVLIAAAIIITSVIIITRFRAEAASTAQPQRAEASSPPLKHRTDDAVGAPIASADPPFADQRQP